MLELRNSEMNMSDTELLRSYVEEASEAAFTELVHRHIDLVFSAALRTANGDSELARDVTQSVFVDLARKARSLLPRKSLSGWLYTSAHYAASKAVRTAERRRNREQEAVAMQDLSRSEEVNWNVLEPVIERAMHQLSAEDREAILLRYFEKRELRAVGETLGITEEAARKKVHRAVERLRNFLAQHGITSSTASLAAALASSSVSAAPAHLAATIVPLALAGAATSWPILGPLFTMATTKTKMIAASAVLVGGLATSVIQYQSNQQLQREIADLRNTAAQAENLRLENERLAKFQLSSSEQERLQKEKSELMKLRAEVARLRDQARNVSTNAPAVKSAPKESASEPQAAEPVQRFVAQAEVVCRPGESILTGGWATAPGKRTFLLVIPSASSEAGASDNVEIATSFIDLPEELANSLQSNGSLPSSKEGNQEQILNVQQKDDILNAIQQASSDVVVTTHRMITVSGHEAIMDSAEEKILDGKNYSVGPTIRMAPSIGQNGTINLSMRSEIVAMNPDFVGNENRAKASDGAVKKN